MTQRESGVPSAAKEFDREMLATRMLEIVRDVAVKVA